MITCNWELMKQKTETFLFLVYFAVIALLSVSSCTYISTKSLYHTFENENVNIGFLPGSVIVDSVSQKRHIKGIFYKGGEKLIVIFHGNYGTVNSELFAAKQFVANNYSVLIPEYPGFGMSKSYEASEKNIYADCSSLIRSIQKEFNFSSKNTVLYGRSLGAAVAIEMAIQNLGGQLILITPFTSMNDMFVFNGAPSLFVSLINDQHYDNLEKAKKITISTLIIATDKDRIVPSKMAKVLDQNFANSTLAVIHSKSHGAIYNYFTKNIWSKILNFQ